MRAPLYSQRDDELFDPAGIVDPAPLYTRLREETPLSRVADTGVHIIASWSLVQEVLEREADFSANLTGVLIRGDEGRPAIFELPESDATRVIATADEPDHGIHRRLLQGRFTPTAMTALNGPIETWVEEELTQLTTTGGGDLIEACERVPARVVAALLGLPPGDVDDFRRWAMMGGDMLAGEADMDTLLYLAEQTAQMADYLGGHLDAAAPAQSDSNAAPILSVLAAAVADGTVNREQAVGIAMVLFGAGGESTAALMGSCFKRLLESPALQQQLWAQPDLIARFVEEVVRLESPFKFHYRVVKQACELGGYQLLAGDRLMLSWYSSNRDPERIDAAAELQLDRAYPKQHMGFGRGAHFCIGAVLARLEAKLMIRQWLSSGLTLELVGPADDYAPSIFVRRLQSLKVRVTS